MSFRVAPPGWPRAARGQPGVHWVGEPAGLAGGEELLSFREGQAEGLDALGGLLQRNDVG